MTKCSKEVQEVEFKFYSSLEDARGDKNFKFSIVDVEGGVPPHTVTKTLIKNSNELKIIGEGFSIVAADNLCSAIFKLKTIQRETPADIIVQEKVYILNSIQQ